MPLFKSYVPGENLPPQYVPHVDSDDKTAALAAFQEYYRLQGRSEEYISTIVIEDVTPKGEDGGEVKS
jgi:hypothetical protein